VTGDSRANIQVAGIGPVSSCVARSGRYDTLGGAKFVFDSPKTTGGKCGFFHCVKKKEEGRRKKEEGRRKKEEDIHSKLFSEPFIFN